MEGKKKRIMKVLICAPSKGTVGGISTWTNHIIRYYKEHKDKLPENFFLYFYSTNRESKVYSNSTTVKRLFSGLKDYFPIIQKYKVKINSNHYDLVHITSSASFGLLRDILMIKAAKRKGIKIVIHFRFGRIPDLYKKNNWEQKLISRVITAADTTIVIDKKSYDTLVNEGFKNIELLPNPLTPEIPAIIKDNLDIVRKDRKLVFAGHVVETKGVFELIEVCKAIPNIKLKLIGAVSTEVKLKLVKLAGEMSTDWLEVSGELSFRETIKEMLSAGVFILPSYTEGFPNVIIESMACACPIVASSVGAIPEMLDVKSETDYGICVEPKNVNQLKNAIHKMLDDRPFALQCGLNAQRRVQEEYSMPKVWDKLMKIWN